MNCVRILNRKTGAGAAEDTELGSDRSMDYPGITVKAGSIILHRNIVTVDQLVGAISGCLILGQSLLLVWPHLTGLAALMLTALGGSYIGFMRQEIRSS